MALMDPSRFWERLRSGRTTVCDGAMGSELMRHGVAPEDVVRSNMGLGAFVRGIHDGYIAAGAELITSNTFGMRNGDDWTSNFRAGAAIAVQAALASSRDVGVWLSLPAWIVPREQRTLQFLSQTLPMWPQMLLIETCTSLDEARAAARSSAALHPKVLAISAHFRADGKMPDGTTPEDFAEAATLEGAHIVGANCGEIPEPFVDVTARMRRAVSVPLLVQPSAGIPERDETGAWRYPVDPVRFAHVAEQLAQAGANIIGGCCGASRDYIAAILNYSGVNRSQY